MFKRENFIGKINILSRGSFNGSETRLFSVIKLRATRNKRSRVNAKAHLWTFIATGQPRKHTLNIRKNITCTQKYAFVNGLRTYMKEKLLFKSFLEPSSWFTSFLRDSSDNILNKWVFPEKYICNRWEILIFLCYTTTILSLFKVHCTYLLSTISLCKIRQEKNKNITNKNIYNRSPLPTT